MTLLWILLLLLAGALARRRWRLAAVAAAGLYVWAWSPFATLMAGSLERKFSKTELPQGDADAIVVLSGNFYPPDAVQSEMLPGYGTYLRCRHAALLYRKWKAAPVVVTAGPLRAFGKTYDTSAVMRRELESAGVPAERIWSEGESHSTHENAANTARLLAPKGIRRIALVTEAFHMRRAARAFEKQGLEVVAAPCCFRSARFEGTWREYVLPHPGSIVSNEECLHEWIGLAWYAVTGRG
jgi:uncharacterized SAM-binding protein YcdF (DUF218 family)